MSLKIRLQRQGKKKQAFYHIVIADSRSPRYGKYIERLGTYNPRFDRDGVTLDNDKVMQWLEKGALPTESCRNLLSERGLMFKKHLHRGVKKGLFTMEQADEKFAKWDGLGSLARDLLVYIGSTMEAATRFLVYIGL